MNSKYKLFRILAVCGACISFYIGAGFATMQEVIQYEVSYGSSFWIVILICAAIYLYTNISFATNGNRLGLTRGGEIYEHYCGVFGKIFGKIGSVFFDWFSAIFCFLSFIVMCGGASSTANQQWGIPEWIGGVVLTILVIATVVFGLDGIVNALSKIGPIIIALILFVSVWSFFTGFDNIGNSMQDIDTGKYSEVMEQVGGGNPFLSGFSYGGFVILWFAAFLAELGAKNKLNEVNKGMGLSSLFIFAASAICCLALIGHIDTTANAKIPAIILAKQISPLLATIFSIIICAGIYTSAVPLLWTSVRKIAKEGTNKYRIITIASGIIACLISIFVPYQKLVNIIYGINGYLGFVLIFFMIIYDIKTRMSSKATKQ